MQGFLFSKPLSLKSLSQSLTSMYVSLFHIIKTTIKLLYPSFKKNAPSILPRNQKAITVKYLEGQRTLERKSRNNRIRNEVHPDRDVNESNNKNNNRTIISFF